MISSLPANLKISSIGQNRDFWGLRDAPYQKHRDAPVKLKGRPLGTPLKSVERAPLKASGAFLRGTSALGSYVGTL